jgi:hypothetical protein
MRKAVTAVISMKVKWLGHVVYFTCWSGSLEGRPLERTSQRWDLEGGGGVCSRMRACVERNGLG